MTGKTLYDKIWDAHVVHEDADGTCLLYIDRHLVHEVTSPQAFEGLRMTGRTVRAPERTIAVPVSPPPPQAPIQLSPESMDEGGATIMPGQTTSAVTVQVDFALVEQ